MATTAIFLHFRPHRHHRSLLQNATTCVRFYSSSDDNDRNPISPSKSQSDFSDVKTSLKNISPPSPPQLRPSFYNPNSSSRTPATQKVPLEEISKSLSNFRREPSVQTPQSPARAISFQELYQKNATPKSDTGSGFGFENSVKRETVSLETIRMSLRNLRPSQSTQSPQSKPAISRSPMDNIGLNLKLKPRPTSLNEMPSDSTRKSSKFDVGNETKTLFVRQYGYDELGERLRKLRPGDKKTKFSLAEMNERLRMVREMEEKEVKNETYMIIRESLHQLHDSKKDAKKIDNLREPISSIFSNEDSRFMLRPPKEALVEKYFHPDHMSSAEKQKLELKNVREKFKISESDCGSARVQVAQLTTKIKHLATVLHKKDKHSRKGLQAMVQKRKKLLKYLRRTDWDSYCFCLSELGLRDSANSKA